MDIAVRTVNVGIGVDRVCVWEADLSDLLYLLEVNVVEGSVDLRYRMPYHLGDNHRFTDVREFVEIMPEVVQNAVRECCGF